jgi:flagellar biosynthesis protein FlhB
MSLQELKDEFKQDEGDPLMKALRKGMYDELMLANLEKRVRRSEFILIERSL